MCLKIENPTISLHKISDIHKEFLTLEYRSVSNSSFATTHLSNLCKKFFTIMNTMNCTQNQCLYHVFNLKTCMHAHTQVFVIR